MIVADTSALISLASIDILPVFLEEFDVHTTETVVEELEETRGFDDAHADAAESVLNQVEQITVHPVDFGEFYSSRVDRGEGSCALLTKELNVDFLITDNLRALPELQAVADAKTAISIIVLKALVKRDVLEHDEAIEKLEEPAHERDWLGTPIYTRAKNLFDPE